MTRVQATQRHAQQRRRANTLERRNWVMLQAIATLLELQIREADNPPELIRRVRRIAKKYLPPAA